MLISLCVVTTWQQFCLTVTFTLILQKISGLSNLKRLSKLYLYGNQISHIQGLSSLGNLELLWLSNNSITGIQVRDCVTINPVKVFYFVNNMFTVFVLELVALFLYRNLSKSEATKMPHELNFYAIHLTFNSMKFNFIN